jgi:hypothetical protein
MNNKRKNEMGYSSPTNNLWIVMGWESCNWAGIGHYLLGRAVAWREEPASIFSWEQIAPTRPTGPWSRQPSLVKEPITFFLFLHAISSFPSF